MIRHRRIGCLFIAYMAIALALVAALAWVLIVP